MGTPALRAELRADAALHVVSAERQERHEAGDEPLLNDAGVKEATCRDKRSHTDGPLQFPSSDITGTHSSWSGAAVNWQIGLLD